MLLNRLHLKSNRHSIQRYYNVSWFFDISHRWDTIKMNGRSQSTLFYGKLKRNWFHMMDSSLRNLILMMFGGVTVNVANARWKVVVDSDFEVMRSNLGNRLHFAMPVFSKFINRYTQTKKAKIKKTKKHISSPSIGLSFFVLNIIGFCHQYIQCLLIFTGTDNSQDCREGSETIVRHFWDSYASEMTTSCF